MAQKIKAELAATDPGFCFEAGETTLPEQTLSTADSAALWQFLFLLPDGMRQMSREMPGLVHCSSNIGILTMSPEQIYLCDCVRSAEDSLGENLAAELLCLAGLLGFTAKRGISFSGWKYDPSSQLRALCMQVYKDMFGREMELQATHGGLECGEFKGKFPDMDIMTVAPTCDGAHTPEEYVDLASFARTYDYLFEVFRALCNQKG
ncbi:Cytosol non-specific dipeptidase [bioreactor metagenome]|uniref:Cytosol non-specific dipeptidase n=1 Tax=bioreactor metagenome TaxID=1076179 RepID=A0A645G9S7_9ZZZZ